MTALMFHQGSDDALLFSDEGRRVCYAAFIPHSGFARGFHPGSAYLKELCDKVTLSRRDQFAEHLANGLTVPQAAQRLGITNQYGNAMLQRIRHKIGPQAR